MERYGGVGNPGTGVSEIPSVPAGVSAAAGGEIGDILNSIGGARGGAGRLEQELYQQLRAALPDGGTGVILDQATLPADLKLPAEGWEARFDFRIPSRATGMIPFTGTVTAADGRLVRRFAGSVRLDRDAQGVQVTRVVRRGERIAEGDVQVMKARLGQLERGAFDDAAFVAGTVARQELRPGRWVTEQMVEVPKAVKRGQGVTVRLQRGPIQITAPGICAEAGALGQVIKVQNAQSKREVFARVISGDEVQVIF